MKKILKIISIPLVVILFICGYIIYLNIHSKNYLDSITKDIKNNYQIDEQITYSNKYNNYYIFTTKTRVIVLNNEYNEILKEDINTITQIPKNMKLIYKTNKLMFEETILEDNKLTYKYYDANNKELVKETIMEKK